MQMPKPKRWEILSWIPIIVGLYWLLARSDGHWLFWALLPGSVLLTTGVSLLLLPGDPRISAYMALASVVGVVFAVILFLIGNVGPAFVCLIGSAACFLVAGRVGLTSEALDPDAPALEMSLEMDAKAGLDEALLGYFVAGVKAPSGDKAEQMCEDAFKLEAIIRAQAWDQDDAAFHRAPPPPGNVGVERKRVFGYDYEELRWDSGFLPDDALPGAALWKRHTANNQCVVRVLRHAGPPRPWLLCIHGYRMGAPWMDLGMFHPRWLHQRLGLNIVQPVLPLHGPRRIGARSGDYYLDGNVLDLVYAQAQALWDLRRTVAWIRSQESEARIGVFGVSLGGYNASLLANYEPGLDFVVAGIPVTDFASALWRFMSPATLRYFTAKGLDESRFRRILELVSPLQKAPLLDKDRLLIFAAAADRIVLPRHPIALSRHWGVPVNWYQGSHLTLRSEPETRETLREAFLRAGWPAVG
jgi:hypothetical protein